MSATNPPMDLPGTGPAPGEPVSEQVPSPAPEADGPQAPDVAGPESPEERRRRRRFFLLFLLLALLTILVGFLIWYLIFRQPIQNIIPNPNLTTPPAYRWSAYGADHPLDVAVTADGSRWYVTQSGADQSTLILDGAGNTIGVLAPPAEVTARATQLYVAVDPRNGDVYATDRIAGAVFVYGADGTYLRTMDPGSGIGAWQPLGIGFDTQGDLYVGDAGGPTQRVHVFGPDGTWLRDLGAADQVAFPNGVAVDKDGNVYVSDSNNGRLLVYDAAGTLTGTVRRGTAQGELGMPRGIAADAEGRVYVVDSVGQHVQLYGAVGTGDAAPVFLAHFGTEGSSDGAFHYPNGVAVDGRGHVYVTDWGNDRIQVWSY